ncbi:hypothetical protein ACFPRL_10850 [Pseudoclavibacter helvolus]
MAGPAIVTKGGDPAALFAGAPASPVTALSEMPAREPCRRRAPARVLYRPEADWQVDAAASGAAVAVRITGVAQAAPASMRLRVKPTGRSGIETEKCPTGE